MKKYFIGLSLLAILNTPTEAAIHPFSPKCEATLHPLLNALGMNLDDLKNEKNAQKFKNYYYEKTEKWNELLLLCAPTALESVNCGTCSYGKCMADIFSACFWNCHCNPTLYRN